MILAAAVKNTLYKNHRISLWLKTGTLSFRKYGTKVNSRMSEAIPIKQCLLKNSTLTVYRKTYWIFTHSNRSDFSYTEEPLLANSWSIDKQPSHRKGQINLKYWFLTSFYRFKILPKEDDLRMTDRIKNAVRWNCCMWTEREVTMIWC